MNTEKYDQYTIRVENPPERKPRCITVGYYPRLPMRSGQAIDVGPSLTIVVSEEMSRHEAIGILMEAVNRLSLSIVETIKPKEEEEEKDDTRGH